jgi:superfamily II DNA/RNA helicase
VLNASDVKNGIIFCNRKTDVDIVAKSLQRHGYSAAPLHGDLDQRFRMQTLDRFKTGDVKLLVASDVAARGLDIPDVSHVFNYEPSRHADDYVHRIGRTGRAGRSGASFTLIAPSDDKYLQAIEKLIGSKIEAAQIDGAPTERLGDEADHGGRGRRREERVQEDRRRQKGRRRDGSDRRPSDTAEPPPAREERRERSGQDRSDDRRGSAERDQRPRERSQRDQASREHAPREQAPREQASRDQRPREAKPDRQPAQQAKRPDGVLGFGDDMPAFLSKGARRSD